jgi:hypothetical protein
MSPSTVEQRSQVLRDENWCSPGSGLVLRIVPFCGKISVLQIAL